MQTLMPTIRPTALVPIFGGFTLGSRLWDVAGRIPSLDLQLATTKSLVDATTGAQLVTHTRASSGTYVGSEGVIRTAVTNLLLRSEEFDAWNIAGTATVTPNGSSALNGSMTADLLSAAAFSDYVYLAPSTIIGLTYTFSIYLKNSTASKNRL